MIKKITGVVLIACALSIMGETEENRKQKLSELESAITLIGKKITEQEDVIFALEKRILDLKNAYVSRVQNIMKEKKYSTSVIEKTISELNNSLDNDSFDLVEKFVGQVNSCDRTSLEDLIQYKFITNNYLQLFKFNRLRHYYEQSLLFELIKTWERAILEIEHIKFGK